MAAELQGRDGAARGSTDETVEMDELRAAAARLREELSEARRLHADTCQQRLSVEKALADER